MLSRDGSFISSCIYLEFNITKLVLLPGSAALADKQIDAAVKMFGKMLSKILSRILLSIMTQMSLVTKLSVEEKVVVLSLKVIRRWRMPLCEHRVCLPVREILCNQELELRLGWHCNFSEDRSRPVFDLWWWWIAVGSLIFSSAAVKFFFPLGNLLTELKDCDPCDFQIQKCGHLDKDEMPLSSCISQSLSHEQAADVSAEMGVYGWHVKGKRNRHNFTKRPLYRTTQNHFNNDSLSGMAGMESLRQRTSGLGLYKMHHTTVDDSNSGSQSIVARRQFVAMAALWILI